MQEWKGKKEEESTEGKRKQKTKRIKEWKGGKNVMQKRSAKM